ncbi:MAG: DUF4912 domain-containing protein [Rectinemataceae bacterium]
MRIDKLEALSLEELYALADKTGLDLPPGLERPFVVEEILEVLEEDSEDRRAAQGEAVHIDEKKYSGLRIGDFIVDHGRVESIARRYNETMIHAIVRDPSWAFAYWDVSDSELEALRGEDSSAGLFLRVAEMGQADEQGDAHREYFDIPVADNDLQWYINLPRTGVRFRIDLCARRGGQTGKFRILARSNEVESPRQSLAATSNSLDAPSYELLALSGVEDLPVAPPSEGNPLRILSSGLERPSDRAD